MTSPEGGFYSATDADSEGVEGKFFVWTPEEIRKVVPTDEDARRFCAYYDITPGGNWIEPAASKEQRAPSIPNVPRPLVEVARTLGIPPEELRQTIDRLRPLIYEARQKRVPPGLDDKTVGEYAHPTYYLLGFLTKSFACLSLPPPARENPLAWPPRQTRIATLTASARSAADDWSVGAIDPLHANSAFFRDRRRLRPAC